MKSLDRLHHLYRRDPDGELRRIQGRFRVIRNRHDRNQKLRRLFHQASIPAIAALAAVMLYLGLTSAFPQMTILALDDLPRLPYVARDDVVFYRNCDAARAAGAAPIYFGQAGYRPALDRDNDGIACEPWTPR